jgi:co-chaperonin GroES (HSP10)
MSKLFYFNTEPREKVDENHSFLAKRKEELDLLKKKEAKPFVAPKAIAFLANYVVVTVDREFEGEINTPAIKLDLVVPRQTTGQDDATRRDKEKEDPERAFNPLKRKRNYGTVVTIPKELTKDIKIYQKDAGLPAPVQYIDAEDSQRLGVPYQCGGWKPEHVTCADIVPEVQVGDKIYFHYLTIDKSNELTGEDGCTYYKLRYNNIFCVVRDGRIIPIGGYILLESVYDDDVEKLPETITEKGERLNAMMVKRSKTGIIIDHHVKPKAVEGIVRHVGTPLRVNRCEIAPGHVVAFELNSDLKVPIEGKEYYVIPYRDILGKVK